MSNREEGTCAGRYDANKVDNTPLKAPTACVVRKTEEGPERIYHSDERKKYDASINTLTYVVQIGDEGLRHIYAIAVRIQI